MPTQEVEVHPADQFGGFLGDGVEEAIVQRQPMFVSPRLVTVPVEHFTGGGKHRRRT